MKSKTMWKRMGMLGLSTMMALSSFNIPIHANTLQGLSETARATEIRNVALDGTAEVSCITDDNGQLHGPEHINDGDVSTGSYWDSGISDEEVYAILDLKQDYDITEINLITYWGRVWQQSYDRWYKYEIYVSNDKETWTKVAEKTNEDPATSAGETYTFEDTVNARYVKVKSLGGNNADPTIFHLVELQVFAEVETNENLALNKPVEAANGNASLITDGIKTNYWDGGEGPQSFVVDLEDFYRLSEIVVYPYYADGRHYHYEIAVSDNGYNYTKVAEKTSDEAETAAGTAYDIADQEQTARYVKVTMLSNSANASVHMNEIEVYGDPDPDHEAATPIDPEDPDNIAFAKETRANSGASVSKWTVDGDVSSSWSAFVFPACVDVDLGSNYDLSDVTVYFPEHEDVYYQYSIYTSTDGASFDRVVQKHDHDLTPVEGDTWSLEGITARVIRVNVEFVSAGASSYLSEIRVHGSASEEPVVEHENLTIDAFADTEYAAPITEEETLQEVRGLIERRLGAEYVDWFELELAEGEKDYFELSMHEGKVHIKGNEGVSLTSGLNYYLKNYCNAQITQQTEQLNTLPDEPAEVTAPVHKDTDFEIRYAYNYCTLSYTMAFWGEEEWQRELDWLALNGVNVVLDTTGLEAVWIDFLQKLGYSSDEAKNWLVGPGYTAWQFMSNMENYGGPLNDQYILDRLDLARKNQRKMRALGMEPVQQGYAGMIPSDYDQIVGDDPDYQKFVDAMMDQGSWGGQFNRPDMLKTNTEAFEEAAELFYESQEKVLGNVTSYYAVDPFHEGGIPPADMSSAEISETVLRKMMEHDENAVWMIQSWEGNPTMELLEGLGENRTDHAVILDLSATTDPHYNNSRWGDEFDSTPWIYCMLDNFGDRPGVHGELEVIASQVPQAYAESDYMKGIGITPEGTNLNPVNYELFFETAWEDDEIDVEEWLKDYVTRRYGEYSDAAYRGWLKLLDSAYGATGAHWGGFNAIANQRPGSGVILGNKTSLPYDYRTFAKAVENIMEDYDQLSDSESYLYDVAALLKQLLQNSQLTYYRNFESAFNNGDLETFNINAEKFLGAIELTDQIAATQQDDLLGEWIGKAKDRSEGYDDYTKDMFEFNAKALITTWGGRNSARTLGDYAYRQYAGLESDYVLPRWEKYLDNKRSALEGETTYTEISYDTYFNDMWDFILNGKEYTRETTDAKSELKRLGEIVLTDYNESQDKVVTDDNIAVNTGVVSSNGDSSDNPLAQINDNNDDSLWVSSNGNTPASVTFDLDGAKEVYKIQTVFEQEPAASRGLFIDFTVEAEQDGEWQKIYTGSTSREQQSFDFLFDQPESISKVRITITDVDGALYPAIAEVRIFSSKGILLKEGSEMTIENGALKDVSAGSTVADLKEQLYAEVGEITFLNDGSVLADADEVTNGTQIQLSVEGTIVDALNIALKEESVPEAGEAAIQALRNMVDKAVALGSEDAALNAAIANAQAVLAKEAPTVTEVVTALLDLSEAMQALNADESVDALRADVQATIDFINENILNDVEGLRPGKVEALRDAVKAAQDVVDDPDATADELKAANKAMTKAAQELWEIVTKAELNALIEAANGYLEGDYTTESLEALQAAITAAQAVAANDDATTAEVTEAITNLANAIAGLESTVVDTSALAHEIELVTEMIANLDDYVPSTVEGLQDKLAAAKNALALAASQEEIDAATEALREARLNARTKADVSALEELINYVMALDMSGYTHESAAEVIQTVEQARLMVSDPEATQEDVDAKLNELQTAIDGLVQENSAGIEESAAADPTDTASGTMTNTMFALTLAAGAAAVIAYRRKKD